MESLMNEWVRLNAPVLTKEMSLEEAKRTGAIAMFGEKYGNVVRVVSMGDFSLEFCGGTHVSSTGEIGPVKVIAEGSIASGVRRVEALSGPKAWDYISQHMHILATAADRLRIRPVDLIAQIDRLQDQIKAKEKHAQTLGEKLALSHAAPLLAQAEQVGDLRLIIAEIPDVSAEGLKTLADHLRRSDDNLVVALATRTDPDKVSFVAGISDSLVKRGLNAGKLVKDAAAICGGSGGGRPELAQAGAKDPGKTTQALATVRNAVLNGVNART